MPSLTGFAKPLTETPRSASTVSDELMTRFNIRDIDGLMALVPGSFTQSFFGVAGTLDIRGTSGDVYFRGIRRLDNAGNYPTPIGASERVDVVRGPASPIHGPAKIGGYLNFNPKSARIEATGATRASSRATNTSTKWPSASRSSTTAGCSRTSWWLRGRCGLATRTWTCSFRHRCG